MCILRYGGERRSWALALGLCAFVACPVPAAPALPSQEKTIFSDNSAWDSAEEDPVLLVRSMTVNGRALPVPAGESLSLPAQPDSIIFTFGPNPQASNRPLRFRCQLDGYEREWHERSEMMRLLIRFNDASQRDVSEQVFEVRGESPGWTGSFTNSPWVRRKEVITVPADVVRFKVVMTSAGPPEAVGVFAIRNLLVFLAEGDTNGVRLIPPLSLDATNAAMEAAEVSPAGWGRSGIRPTDAQLLSFDASEEVALAILDDHPQGHADWGTARLREPVIKPGQKLTFAWEEVYSIGVADYGRTEYMKVPAGLYRLRMEALDLMGVPTGRSSSRLVAVPVAAWKTLWFWVTVVVASFATAAGSWRVAESRRMARQVNELKQQRDLEQERFRIAQNIHDDLGARVTEIALLSSSAQLKPNIGPEARADFGAVSRLTGELVEALHETVWAVNPKDDHLDSLASFVCQMANKMCAQAQLRCRLQIPDMSKDVPVDSPVRHHVIMAVKEAIHNVIKHGRASEIQIHMREVNGGLTIEVSDNGRGFDPAATIHGNGLDNMNRRMRSMKGTCLVTSRPGAGTVITFEFPFRPFKQIIRGE